MGVGFIVVYGAAVSNDWKIDTVRHQTCQNPTALQFPGFICFHIKQVDRKKATTNYENSAAELGHCPLQYNVGECY
jgi:hypothetical protein